MSKEVTSRVKESGSGAKYSISYTSWCRIYTQPPQTWSLFWENIFLYLGGEKKKKKRDFMSFFAKVLEDGKMRARGAWKIQCHGSFRERQAISNFLKHKTGLMQACLIDPKPDLVGLIPHRYKNPSLSFPFSFKTNGESIIGIIETHWHYEYWIASDMIRMWESWHMLSA